MTYRTEALKEKPTVAHSEEETTIACLGIHCWGQSTPEYQQGCIKGLMSLILSQKSGFLLGWSCWYACMFHKKLLNIFHIEVKFKFQCPLFNKLNKTMSKRIYT